MSSNNKICIVTALAGNKEELSDPSVYFANADYYAFTTKPFTNIKIWNQYPILDFSNDLKYYNRRNAKIYKILPEFFIPGYDFYIWVDVSCDVICNPEEIINNYLKNDYIAVFKHRERNCIYEEAKEIIKIGYDHKNLIDQQIQFYRESGYPENNGLYELPGFIKRNCREMTAFNLFWWEQLCKFSSRDQISFPFSIWKKNIPPVILPGFINGGEHNNLITQIRIHRV